MSTPIHPDQLAYVRHFILFMGEQIKQTTTDFEASCELSHHQLAILTLLMQKNSLMVKEIASELTDLSLSTLTRLLDSLEAKEYIRRNLDPRDRRSFRITPTEKAISTVQGFCQQIEIIADRMLAPLTSTERLILLELFRKIEAEYPRGHANEQEQKEAPDES